MEILTQFTMLTMTGRNISILFVLLINFNAFASEPADNTSCAVDLPSFIAAFRSNETSTDNVLKIQQTFYPHDKAAPHYVYVYYYYQEPGNNSDTANYTYIWTDNAIFFVVGYYLFSALTFELADLGGIGEQFFVIPQSCNNTNTKDLLLALTRQLKSIGGTDKALYFAGELGVEDNTEYSTTAKVIFSWLITTSFLCITAIHCLMWFPKSRKYLDEYLKRYIQKYLPNPSKIDKKRKRYSAISDDDRKGYSEIPDDDIDESTLFFFIERILFPVMVTAAAGLTAADIYFFTTYNSVSKYTSDSSFFLFPWPFIDFVILLNTVATTCTVWILYHQNSLKCRSCRCFLTTLTLFSLFGIMSLFFHVFWMTIALLAYPGRILMGGIFVIPFLLVTIPTWNIVIKIFENCCWPCKREKVKVGCIMFLLLIADVSFWGLFIGTLIHISRFLLSSSIILENNTLQSLVSFIVVSAVSWILTWLSTDLVYYQKNQKNQEKSTANESRESGIAMMSINTNQ